MVSAFSILFSLIVPEPQQTLKDKSFRKFRKLRCVDVAPAKCREFFLH